MLHKQFRVAFKAPNEFWRALRDYLGGASRRIKITDTDSLADFLDTRASHVAQSALYGYLRTRAGTSYPELFNNDDFMISVNRAKWRMWVACLSDLSVFAGGLMANRSGADEQRAAALIGFVGDTILKRAGEPADAGDLFAGHAAGMLTRIRNTRFSLIGDDDSAFTESPSALVECAPVIESIRDLDSEIVRNSVRFRWQEVRRDFRRGLDHESVFASFEAPD
jgi:hypothetical protein